eukprot:COSAG01_NODE_36902_length_511_cov_0.873786_2_plen_29_part_01
MAPELSYDGEGLEEVVQRCPAGGLELPLE